jgi:Trk-type K+ transport systems, membrane components
MFTSFRVRINSMARRENNALKILGFVEIALGIMLIVPTLIAFKYGEDPSIFAYPIPFLLIFGLLQYLKFKSNSAMPAVNGMLTMFAAWLVAFIVSSLPFYLYGFSAIDSIFEGVSGFTTTGASTILDFESLPHSLLFWRSFTQWAGGISVVMIFMFLIPMMGLGGRAFKNNELAGSDTYNFSMQMKSSAQNFISIYALLTAAEAILLMLCGVDLFESVSMTMSTISTGGLMIRGDSMMSYSVLVQGITVFFMFMGGTNFYLHYRALYKRDIKAYAKSQEFIWTIIWFMIAAATIGVILLSNMTSLGAKDVGGTIWDAIFMVVSVGTSTGYYNTDFTVWPIATILILLMLSVFGSMSGSTSGGVKIYRLLMIKSYVSNGIHKMFHPYDVRDIKVDGHSADNDSIVSAVVVIVMFLATWLFSTFFLLIVEPGMSMNDAVGLSISSLGNVGINMGDSTFHDLNGATKVFLSFVMWVGRLEVVMALLLFTKTFWTEIFSGLRGQLNIRRSKRN